MSTNCGSVNCTLGDGSVRAMRTGPVTLAALARGLPRQRHPARAVGWGGDTPLLQALLAGLKRHGASIGALALRPAADPLPVLMVIADRRDALPPSALLLVAADAGPGHALLLPAVQHLREAARRLAPEGDIDLVLVQRPPGSGPRRASEIMSFNFAKVDPL